MRCLLSIYITTVLFYTQFESNLRCKFQLCKEFLHLNTCKSYLDLVNKYLDTFGFNQKTQLTITKFFSFMAEK